MIDEVVDNLLRISQKCGLNVLHLQKLSSICIHPGIGTLCLCENFHIKIHDRRKKVDQVDSLSHTTRCGASRLRHFSDGQF